MHVVRLYLPDGSNAEPPRRAYLEARNQLVSPGTLGAELLDELKPEPSVALDADLLLSGEPQQVGPREWFMYKPRWGAFYRTALEGHLRALRVDTVVVCGCNFPNCPRTTIYEASERDFNIVFIDDATSGVYARGLEELRVIGVLVPGADECASWLHEIPFMAPPGLPAEGTSGREFSRQKKGRADSEALTGARHRQMGTWIRYSPRGRPDAWS